MDELTEAAERAVRGYWNLEGSEWRLPEVHQRKTAERVVEALTPLIEARERRAHFNAVPNHLYGRIMDLLMSHPNVIGGLTAANELRKIIGASAQRRAEREAAGWQGQSILVQEADEIQGFDPRASE